MSYFEEIKYQIVPKESFFIQRKCAGCGKSSIFLNTNCFRVNANGNKVDVWLIYQCKTCKHTYNLTIYERQKPEEIPQKEYEKFLENDKQTAFYYGTNSSFFTKNKADILWNDLCYRIEKVKEYKEERKQKIQHEQIQQQEMKQQNDIDFIQKIEIKNPYRLKVRSDKIIAELFQLSRSQLKKYKEAGKISMQEDKQSHTICLYAKDINIECTS